MISESEAKVLYSEQSICVWLCSCDSFVPVLFFLFFYFFAKKQNNRYIVTNV